MSGAGAGKGGSATGGGATPVELVNWTGHELVIGRVDGSDAVIAQSAETARVAEPLLGRGQLSTQHGAFDETCLRRSTDVPDLPASQPGVIFVVSRLTALAARSRTDLVFPHGERRVDGQVLGADGLGRFEALPSRRRQLGRMITRAWRDPQRISISSGVAFALATALLGGALGVLPDLVAGDPDDHDFWLRLATTLAVAGLGAGTLMTGVLLWRRRQQILTSRGTAYIVEETAHGWTYEEKRSFLESLDQEFAVVLRVPGPADLGAAWHWPLIKGAPGWGQKVDELVRSFWAVHFNDDQVTHNAVFVWAPWPVAVAFAAQVIRGRRGLTLRVRQRPSTGRRGPLDPVALNTEPHLFLPDPQPDLDPQPTPGPDSSVPINLRIEAPRDGTAGWPAAAAGELTVLLVRMTPDPWGPLPALGQAGPSAPDASLPLTLTIRDATGVLPLGPSKARLHEWRHTPVDSSFHDWSEYPTLARSAAAWISTTAAAAKGPVLLGLLVPQEVSVGIGVLIAHTPDGRWPDQLLPLLYEPATTNFVIPGLDLGWTSLHTRE